MGLFMKISRWLISILIFAIGLPFCSSLIGIPIVLCAVLILPLKKVDEFRERLFKKKSKTSAEKGGETAYQQGAFINIGPWDIPADEYINTAARYERGLQIERELVGTIDRKMRSARIMGAEGYAYKVTLSGCECMDYHQRRLPCKHMLRLARELGEDIMLPTFDPLSNSNYNPQEDIAMLTKRWEAGQISTDTYKKCIKALQSSVAE